MILDLPNVGKVEFADNISPSQFRSQVKSLADAYDFDPEPFMPELRPLTQLRRGVARGVGQLGIALGDVLPAMVASGIGADEYAKQQMEEAAASQARLAAKYPSMVPSYTDISTPMEAITYGAETIGEVLPSAATAIVPGLGGAALATRMGVSASTGMLGGVFMGSFVQNAPEVFQNIYEETGALEPAIASLFGGVSSTLDSILPASLLSRLGRYGKVKVAENLIGMSGASPSVMARAGAITKAVGKASLTEGMTESTQEAIGALAEQVAGSTKSLLDPENIQRFKEAFVKGAVGGSVFGIPGGVADVMEGNRIRREREAEQAAAAEAETPAVTPEAPAQPTPEETALLEGPAPTPPTPPLPAPEAVVEEPTLAAKPRNIAKEIGVNPRSKAGQAIADLDLSTPEGVNTLITTLETPGFKGKINEQAYDALIQTLDPEAVTAAREQVKGAPRVTRPQPAAVGEGAGVVTPAGADVAAAPGIEESDGMGVASTTTDAIPTAGRETGAPAPVTEVIDEVETEVTPPVEAAPGVTAEVVEPGVRAEVAAGAPAGVVEGTVQAADTELVPAVDEAAAAPQLEKPAPPVPYKVVEPKTGRMIRGPELQQAIEAGEAKRQQLLAETEQKIAELTAEQQGLLTPAGKVPFPKSPRRKQYDALGAQIAELETKRKSYAEEATAPTTKVVKETPEGKTEEVNVRKLAPEIPEGAAAVDLAKVQKLLQATVGKTGKLSRGSELQRDAASYFSKHQSLLKALRVIGTDIGAGTPAYKQSYRYTDNKGRSQVISDSDEVASKLQRTGGIHAENAQKWVNENLSPESKAYMDAIIERVRKETARGNKFIGKNLDAVISNQRANEAFIETYTDAEVESAGDTKPDQVAKNRSNRKKSLSTAPAPTKRADPTLEYDVYVPDRTAPVRQGAEPLPPTDVTKLPKPIMEARKEAADRLIKKSDTELFASPEIASLHRPAHVLVEDALADGDIIKALEFVGATSQFPFARSVTKALSPFLQDVKVVYGADRASYDPATNTINLPENVTDYEVLHEATHAALSHVIAKQPGHPIVKRLENIFNDIQKRGVNTYATTNLQEFVAEAWSNNDFRTLLKELPSETTQMSMWDKLVNALRSFFGYPPKALKRSLLDDVDSMISEIISPPPSERDGDTLYAQALNAGGANLAKDTLSEVGSVASGKQFKVFEGDTVTKWLDKIGNLGEAGRAFAIQLLELPSLARALKERVGDIAVDFSDTVAKVEAKNQQLAEANKPITEQLIKLQKNNPAQYRKLSEFIPDHSRDDVDPRLTQDAADKKYGADPKRMAAWQQAVKDYNSLSPEARKLYDSVFAAYKKMFGELKDSLRNGLLETFPEDEGKALSVYNKLIDYITKEGVDHYAPLFRTGTLYLSYTNKNGDSVTEMFDGQASLRKAQEKATRDGATGFKSGPITDKMGAKNVLSGTVAADILKIMKDNGVTENGQQEFIDMFVSYLPETSVLKSFRKREGKLGYIRDDIAYTFDRTTRNSARQISRMRYAQTLNRQIRIMKEEAKLRGNDTFTLQMIDNMDGRRAFAMNPNIANWAAAASRWSFYYNMLYNVSSAVVNFSQVAVATYPQLAGEYGATEAFKMLIKATKLYGSSGLTRKVTDINGEQQDVRAMLSIENLVNAGKADKYKRLFDVLLNERGMLQNTIVGDIVRGYDQANPLTRLNLEERVTKYGALLFQQAERLNREITAVATFDLEMGKLKDDKTLTPEQKEERAIRKAIEVTEFTHGAGHSSTGPSIAQNSIGKALTVFKRIGFLMYYMLFDTVRRSMPMANATPEQKEAIRVARRQLIGIYGMAGIFSGVKGMPMYWVAELLYNTLLADDDEDDFDAVMRKYLGDLVFKGPVNYFTGLGFADRVGWSDLLYREPRSTDSSSGMLAQYLESILGAPYSVVNNAAKGYDLVRQGQFQRGVELMLPVAARNLSKFERYLTEDATTLRGDLVGEVNGYNAMMQALGFAPAELMNQYDRNANLKRIEKNITNKSSNLLKRYYAAYRVGDIDGMMEAQEALYELGARHPGLNITPDKFRRSVKARDRISRDMYHGVSFQRNLRPELLNNGAEYDD